MSMRSREELELDEAMKSLKEPVPSAELRRAVAEIPLRHPRPERERVPWLPVRTVWALAACGVLAVALGALSRTWLGDVEIAFDEQPAVRAAGSDADYDEELLDATELAFAETLDEELLP
jgi:hypothetical protein